MQPSMESNIQFSELRVWMTQRQSLKKLSITKGILQWKNLLSQRDKDMWQMCQTSEKIFNDNLINLETTLHTLHHGTISIAWSPNMLPTGQWPKWDRKRLRSTIGSRVHKRPLLGSIWVNSFILHKQLVPQEIHHLLFNRLSWHDNEGSHS